MARWLKVLVSLLALVGIGMSVWLTVQKMTGKIDSLAGCGAGSGCASVLGSRWSVIFGTVPVSVLSCLVYLAVIGAVWMRGGAAKWLRILCAWLVLGAAAWFVLLQWLVVENFCAYCMSMHSVGAALGGLILLGSPKQFGFWKRCLQTLPVAIAMVMALAAVQYFGEPPATHRVDSMIEGDTQGKDIHGEGAGRGVVFLQGRKVYKIEQLPHLGPADAEYVVVKYFDYTCEACKDMHGDLDKIQAKYPGKLAVILVPTPLNQACNPHMVAGIKNHEGACELAKLALRVWKADPKKFAEFHHSLFEMQGIPTEAAEAMATDLVGEEKLNAVDSAWINEVIKVSCEDYRDFSKLTPKMPKLLLKGVKVQQGITRDTETLERVLREHVGLR